MRPAFLVIRFSSAARFEGYFEQMEVRMMVESGMTPKQVLMEATGAAAKALKVNDVGTLEKGKWADIIGL